MRARRGIVSASVTTAGGTYKDLADFGFTAEAWTDALSGPSRSFPLAPVPGRIETVKLSTDPAIKPGQVQITGTVAGDTMAAYLTNLRNLKGWAVRAVALKLNALDANTFLEVDQREAPVIHFGVPGLTPAARVALTFDALKPYWQSTSVTNNALTTSLTEQALGTAPSRPVITMVGALTDPVIEYADHEGGTVKQLALDLTLPGGSDHVVIDCDAMTVIKTVGGVASDAIASLSSGDFFALDPAHADTETPVWPKLKYSLGGGSVSAVTCVYRKHWY